MEPALDRFHRFSELPAELRLQIWESVPQTPRILGMLACPECTMLAHKHRRVPSRVAMEMEACARKRHRDWRLRWRVLATDDTTRTAPAIFPPLHVCHESRLLWLPRHFVPLRYLDLDPDGEDDGDERHHLRFDLPFVSYETDTFAVFSPDEQLRHRPVNPLLGLDCRRIGHLAVHENAWSMVESLVQIQPQRLCRLRTITVLVLGPDLSPGHDPIASAWLEMPAARLSLFRCACLDIPDRVLAAHPLFTTTRPHNVLFTPTALLQRLGSYRVFFQAWLWHALGWDDGLPRNTADGLDWWAFLHYVFDPSVVDCPLGGHSQWCPGPHTRDDVLQGSDVCIRTKLLAEKSSLAEMTASGALDWDPTGAGYGNCKTAAAGSTPKGVYYQTVFYRVSSYLMLESQNGVAYRRDMADVSKALGQDTTGEQSLETCLLSRREITVQWNRAEEI